MTAIQIIDETVEFYGEDPDGRRSLAPNPNPKDFADKTACLYKHIKADGGVLMCAVGRCMIDPPEKIITPIEDLVEKAPGQSVDEILIYKYAGHPLVFWQELQELHDDKKAWRSTEAGGGLTDRGLSIVTVMKAKYATKPYPEKVLAVTWMGKLIIVETPHALSCAMQARIREAACRLFKTPIRNQEDVRLTWFHDSSGGVRFHDWLVSAAGAGFELLQTPEVSGGDLKRAKALLRRNRDVVDLKVLKVSQHYGTFTVDELCGEKNNKDSEK